MALTRQSSTKHSATKQPPSYTFFTDADLGRYIIPDALVGAGFSVVRHHERFPNAPNIPDPEWFPVIAREGWIALTKDKRQLYDHVDAAMECGLALFMHIGEMAHPQIAESLVMAAPSILRLRARNEPPFLAKVYRPEQKTPFLRKPGVVKIVMTYAEWLEERRGGTKKGRRR